MPEWLSATLVFVGVASATYTLLWLLARLAEWISPPDARPPTRPPPPPPPPADEDPGKVVKSG